MQAVISCLPDLKVALCLGVCSCAKFFYYSS